MKTSPAFFFLLLFFVTLFGCRKSTTNEDSGPAPEPIKTPKGVASGTPVSKQIGSAGGEVASADGKLKVIVPAGAVSTATNFTVQPITNTLFENEGRSAYRLLPEGTTFAKPVTLQFTYAPEDTLHTTEDALTIAYQRVDGAWRVMPAALNKTTKRLTVETTHFSDWTITGGLYIEADEKLLGLGQKTKLRVISVYRPQSNAGTTDEEDVLAPLVPYLLPEDRDKLESIDNWRIASGIGGISVESGQLGKLQTEAEYGAPDDMSDNRRTMTITVDVKGYNIIRDQAAPGGVRLLNKMILFERITVLKEFFKAVIAGTTYRFSAQDVTAIALPSGLMIGARNDSLNLAVLVSGSGAGTYYCNTDNGVQANLVIGTGVYSTGYTKCLGIGVGYSGAPIEIKRVEPVGGWIEGKFMGRLFDNLADPCAGPMPTVAADIEFNIVRKI